MFTKCAFILSVVLITISIAGCGKKQDETALAKHFVDLLAKSDFSGATENFDGTMKAAMPPENLQQLWDQVIAHAGSFKKQTATRVEESAPNKSVFVTCQFERATLDIKVVFNDKKQISGLWMVPSQPPAGS